MEAKYKDLIDKERLQEYHNGLKSIFVSREDGAYEDFLSYGITWDRTLSTPDCVRCGNLSLHKSLPIQSQMKPCIHKGKEIVKYISDISEQSMVTETVNQDLGDNGIIIPEFYIKCDYLNDNPDTPRVRISQFYLGEGWVKIESFIVDCVKSALDSTNNKLRSIYNVNWKGGDRGNYDNIDLMGKPVTYMTRDVARTYARNNSEELMNLFQYEALCWLFYIEYATFDSQKSFNASLNADGFHQGGLGWGITNIYDLSSINKANPIDNNYIETFGTGVFPVTISNRKAYNCYYRGIKNLFGDTWHVLDGVLINTSDNKVSYYATNNPNNYVDSSVSKMEHIGDGINKGGFCKTFLLGKFPHMICTDVGASSSTYKCDYFTTASSIRSNALLVVGGYAESNYYAGLACFHGSFTSDTYARTMGFRTVVQL